VIDMKAANWRITTHPSTLTEGLFGQIALYVFEVLPKLYQKQIFPEWKITSLVYGKEPDFTVLPGVFDLNYKTRNTQTQDIDLRDLGLCFYSVLGNQWETLHSLWNKYFCVPPRIVECANKFGELNNAIGLHYRGTDKTSDLKQTNPVSYNDFITLVNDFINNHEDINTIFIATDEYSIVQVIRQKYKEMRVIDTGEVGFWKSIQTTGAYMKGDHAVLDCLLLSRCKYLLKNQSAMSGFSKVFNPKLQAYRISASKLFMKVPYFPDAYIPLLKSDNPRCSKILKKLQEGDWSQNKKAWEKFAKPFIAMDMPSLRWKVETTYHWTLRKLNVQSARERGGWG
jgi:hypothetical protein